MPDSPAKVDHRKVFVCLTTQGISMLEKLSDIHREELRRLNPQLRLLLKRIDELSGGGNQF